MTKSDGLDWGPFSRPLAEVGLILRHFNRCSDTFGLGAHWKLLAFRSLPRKQLVDDTMQAPLARLRLSGLFLVVLEEVLIVQVWRRNVFGFW